MKTFIPVLCRRKGLGVLSGATLLVQLFVDKVFGGECVRCVGFLQDAYTVCADLPNGR